MNAYEQNQDGDWITLKEAAALLRVHHITLRRWIKAGKIKAKWEYEGDQGRRLIDRNHAIKILKKRGKTDPESGPPARIEGDQIALSINKVNVHLKHLFEAEQESRQEELKNVKEALSIKLFISMGLVVFIGIAVALYIAYIAGVKQEANQKAAKGEMLKGFAYLQEAQNKDQKARRELLEATRTENQATGKKISRQGEDILRTGDQVKAQSAKIERQTAEIKELRAQLIELQTGIEAIRAAVTRSTPGPAGNGGMSESDRGIRAVVTRPTPGPEPAAGEPGPGTTEEKGVKVEGIYTDPGRDRALESN